MTSKFLRFVLAVAVLFTISALAQTTGASPAGTTAATTNPPSTASTPTTTTPAGPTGTKVGAINIEGAIFGSNEGRRDMDALIKKFEPKQTELQNQNSELEALKKQMTTQQASLNEDALNNLKKQIESKQKTFDRAAQDAQEEFGTQQQEIANRVLGKMAPLIVKYATENGYGMIIDTSKPWPQGPVLIAGAGVDITQAVVDAYNVQSGVPAPAATGAAAPKPAAPKPATGTTATPKPAAPKPTTPQTNAPPK
jgi:Skp family chaperone for outer membrane proteins